MTTTRTVIRGPDGSTTVICGGGDPGDFGDFGDFGSFFSGFGGGAGRRSKPGFGTRHGGSEPIRPTRPPMKLEGKTRRRCTRKRRRRHANQSTVTEAERSSSSSSRY